MEYTTRSSTPDKDLPPSLSLSLIDARSELSARARATHNTSDREKSMLLHVSPLLVHASLGACTRVLGGGRGYRAGAERGRPLFLSCAFGDFRRHPNCGVYAASARGNVDIAALVWLARGSSPPPFLPPPHYLSSTRQRLVARTSSSTTLNPFRSSFPRYPS